MRKLILGMSVSLDGFVAGPNGEADWIFRNPDPTVKSWMRERLFRLIIQPVALGRGMPLFSSLPEPLHLRLAGTVSFASGRVAQTYLAD